MTSIINAVSTKNRNTVELYGRFSSSENGWLFDWSGSAIEAGFVGTQAILKLHVINGPSEDYFSVYIDGGLPVLLTVTEGQNRYSVADGLDESYHTIRVEKRTEGSNGALCVFAGFEFPSGVAAPAPARRARTIEFVGDSMTAGYGNLAAAGWNGFVLSEEDYALTYGKLAADQLDATATVIAFSGIGMLQNLDGVRTTTMANTWFWRTTVHDGTENWSFDQKPDVLVVNLGTNDSAYDQSSPSPFFGDEYAACYVDFLENIRKVYPDTHIVCTIGVINSGYRVVPFIETAIKQRKEAGDNNISFCRMTLTETTEAEAWGGDGHPSAKAHAEMAVQMAVHIKDVMNW